MPNPAVALIGAGSTLIGGLAQSSAARSAAGAQAGAAQAGIDEQRRQFDTLRGLLQPYVEAGTPALQGMQALAGLGGAEAQQAAIGQIEASPLLQAQMEQGERALLQRASATGGLRGGNVQAALAQFRPQMLQQAIEQQYNRLGGLTTLGQQSAAGVGTQGTALGQNISNLLQQQGAAQAGARLAGAAPLVGLSQIPGQLAGYQMATGQNVFGNLFGGGAGAPLGAEAGGFQGMYGANPLLMTPGFTG